MRKYLLGSLLLFTFTFNYGQTSENQTYCKRGHNLADDILLREADQTDDANIDLTYCNFDWTIDPEKAFIDGKVKLVFKVVNDGVSDIHLSLSDQLTITSITTNNEVLDYERTSTYDLRIQLKTTLNKGALGEVNITYHGNPPSTGFGSYTKSTHGGAPILFTFSTPYGSRDWWPCKNGLNDKIDSIDVWITTADSYKAASNGKLISVNALSGNTHQFHWKHNYAIVPYLVCFSVTNYKAYSDSAHLSDGTTMEVLNYVYPESENEAKSGTAQLTKVIQYYDSLFYAYPFSKEKYGHAQFSWGGGMEHQTMSFVTNFDIGLLSHELSHQWFGDMVTCGSWLDIWLNEGFATYAEGLMRERFLPGTWKNWKADKILNITNIPSGSVKVSDTTSVNRIFNGRLTYDKGAYLLHMLRWVVGDEDFFAAIRNYLEDFKYKNATTNDLKYHLEQTSGKDLDHFFKVWFEGQGHPTYTINWSNVSKQEVEITVSQKQSTSALSYFELPIQLLAKGTLRDTLIRLENTYNNQKYMVTLPFECKSMAFDPNLWLVSRGNKVNQIIVSNEDINTGNILIYPTITKGRLYIENVEEPMDYIVNDLNGKTILSGNLSIGESVLQLEGIVPGHYFISLINKTTLEKVIKRIEII